MKQYLLIAVGAGFVALIFAGVASGSLNAAPEFNLRLVQGVVCPGEQTLEYRELGQFTYTDADGTHNAAHVSFSCVAADGTRTEGHGTATLGALFGLYFVVSFGPLFGAAALWWWWRGRRGPRRAAAPRR